MSIRQHPNPVLSMLAGIQVTEFMVDMVAEIFFTDSIR
jgi:hypothetical protein